MTTITIPYDLRDVDTVAQRLVTDTTTVLEMLSTHIGLRLGLHAALDEIGPATPSQLAAAAGIHPRYAREWCEQQTVARLLVCEDPRRPAAERRYLVPAAVVATLLDPTSGAFVAPLVELLPGLTTVLDEVMSAYRTGGGVDFAAYGASLRHGLGDLNGATFELSLAHWIRAVPDLHRRLTAAEQPHVLDLGCGTGRSSIALATAYPHATVVGVDLDPASIAEARDRTAATDVADRVSFEVADATVRTDASHDGRYDLITIFEALHDMGDPVGALRNARSWLRPGGSVYVADERCADEFTPDADIVERLQYGFSVLHCLPATMAEDPVDAHGTVVRRSDLQRWAHAAGLDRITELDVDDPFWRHVLLRA